MPPARARCAELLHGRPTPCRKAHACFQAFLYRPLAHHAVPTTSRPHAQQSCLTCERCVHSLTCDNEGKAIAGSCCSTKQLRSMHHFYWFTIRVHRAIATSASATVLQIPRPGGIVYTVWGLRSEQAAVVSMFFDAYNLFR
ncbi:unnamed protein product [Ectocarpus sp. 12 AP-2014]